MKQFYFFKLFHHNRKLFYGILAFTVITIFCNLAGYEATPFFIWAMYSQKEAEPKFYEVQEIILNDSVQLDNTAGYTPSTRFIINSPLWYYISIKNNNDVDPTISFLQSKLNAHYTFIKPYEHVLFNDSSRINEFIPWFKKYLQQVSGINITHLKIINTKLHFSGAEIIKDTSYTIGEWKQ